MMMQIELQIFFGAKLRERGLDRTNVRDGVGLGSGLGGFADDYLNARRAVFDRGSLVVSFGEMWDELNKLDDLETPW